MAVQVQMVMARVMAQVAEVPHQVHLQPGHGTPRWLAAPCWQGVLTAAGWLALWVSSSHREAAGSHQTGARVLGLQPAAALTLHATHQVRKHLAGCRLMRLAAATAGQGVAVVAALAGAALAALGQVMVTVSMMQQIG